jgi:AmiR/NasT family two-component response regulator
MAGATNVFVTSGTTGRSRIAVAFMPYSNDARDIQDWAYQAAQINVVVLANYENPLAWLGQKRCEFDFIFVDIEHAGGVHAAIDLCLGIRTEHPKSKIILLSDNSDRDDFGTERLAICDATLKKPVTYERLTDAIATG